MIPHRKKSETVKSAERAGQGMLPICEIKWPRNIPLRKVILCLCLVGCFASLLKPYISYALCDCLWLSGQKCLQHSAVSGYLISEFDDTSWLAHPPTL